MPTDGKKTLLLVEDQAIVALAEKVSLERYGYTVLHASSGEAALERSRSDPEIDLVVMDVDLGSGMSGPDAARAILAQRDIPVLFLSSHTEVDVVAQTEAITSYGYVVKDTGITVLDASIKMAFKLFAAKRTLEATLDALPDLLLEVDLDGFCYDYHSPRTEFQDKPATTFIGRTLFSLLPQEASSVITSAVHEANESGFSTGKEFEIPISNGTRVFEVSVARKDCRPDPPRFIILRRDITERKKTEEDLRTHQIELKMQNEELREKQQELEELRSRYFDLYDLAPVGYFTVDETGLILEANLTVSTMLGMERGALVRQPISHFIAPEDQDTYYMHRKHLFGTGAPQTCDLQMQRRDGTILPAELQAVAVENSDGARVCRVALVARRGTSPEQSP